MSSFAVRKQTSLHNSIENNAAIQNHMNKVEPCKKEL